jgi:hypothetical protein
MNDTIESSTQAPWLLLVAHLPPKPDYLRVKLRRRMQKIGAVLLKSSVYALPRSEETLEDFQWLRRALVEEGGEAMLCEARLLGGISDDEIRARFRAEADARYAEIAADAGARPGDPAAIPRLRRRLQEAIELDFFEAPGRADAEHAVRAIDIHPEEIMDAATEVRRGSVWVTRRGVKVDRMSSAWLIRRFIDPEAVLRFVAPDQPVDAGSLRFDMFEGEFTHEGERCTFETLLERFGLDDPALRVLGEIIHDIDCKDAKYGRVETPGIAATIDAVIAANPSDEARVAASSALLDGLYQVFRGGPG